MAGYADGRVGDARGAGPVLREACNGYVDMRVRTLRRPDNLQRIRRSRAEDVRAEVRLESAAVRSGGWERPPRCRLRICIRAGPYCQREDCAAGSLAGPKVAGGRSICRIAARPGTLFWAVSPLPPAPALP